MHLFRRPAPLEDTSDVESEEPLLSQEKNSKRQQPRWLWQWQTLSMVSMTLNALLLGVLFGTRLGLHSGPASDAYAVGFATDLEAAIPHIEVVQQRFDGGVMLDADGKFTMEASSDNFGGLPSRKTDEAWLRLLSGLNLDLAASESPDLAAQAFRWPDDGLYFTGLDVFHSLHCLDRLRQALYPDYYSHVFGEPGDPSRDMHIGHCINQVRQALQCHADLTPMEWSRQGGKIILRTDTTHTCRNFDRIQEWALQHQTDFRKKQTVQNGTLFIID